MCKLKDTEAFVAYEKAIEGYQFQVGRYNTWMNYYAIFVGALFIALYSVWPKNEGNTVNEINNVIIGGGHYTMNEVVKAPGQTTWGNAGFLLILISVIGWFASICWYGALLGYRKWNEHWMSVIHEIETKNINKKNELDSYPLVYGKMPESNQQKPQVQYVPGYISTQKITGICICAVAFAWCVVLGYVTYFFSWWVGLIVGVVLSGISVWIIYLLHRKGCKWYSSSIPDAEQTDNKTNEQKSSDTQNEGEQN